jgi:ABC-type uncharacterized transport system ATPase component
VVLDVAGDRREALKIGDLIDMFAQVRGQQLDSDSLLLG